VPAALFPGLEKHDPLPNALYRALPARVRHQYRVDRGRVAGRPARKDDCRRLNLEPGAPLLHIDRVAISLEGARVEWRSSRCDTTHFVYAVTLS